MEKQNAEEGDLEESVFENEPSSDGTSERGMRKAKSARVELTHVDDNMGLEIYSTRTM